MEFQNTINSLKKTFNNKDLLKKESIRKKNKEIKMEKPIISFSINHDSIVQKWNFKK